MLRRQLLAPLMTGLLMIAAPVMAQPLTLIYSGNLDGELEPCGCSAEGDYGGIKRRASYLDKLRETQPDAIAVTTGGLFSAEIGGDPIKDGYILSGLAQLGYSAVGVQWADLLHGVDLLQQHALPYAAANWKGDNLSKARRFEVQGIPLYYTQWLDPETSPYKGMESPIDNDPAQLRSMLEQARAERRLTILGTTLPLELAQSLVPLELVDILLIQSAYEQYGEPQLIDKTLVLQPGSRGQRVGRLDLEIGEGQKVERWNHLVVELGVDVPDAPRLSGWYGDYNEALKQDYLWRVEMRKKIRAGDSPYAGEQVCGSCHAAEHEKWLDTRHAGAFATLEDVNKAFDPNCLQCHTVGFMQPGGYLDLSLTGQLTNVQCENCHGGAAEHVASGGQKPPANADWQPQQICAQCHNHDHSPSFDFDRYWPKIQHP